MCRNMYDCGCIPVYIYMQFDASVFAIEVCLNMYAGA